MQAGKYERELIQKLENEGWLCHRVAGSGQAEQAVCDVVALKQGKARLIEVKSAQGPYYPSGDRKQLQKMKKAASKAGATPVLAVRIKGKSGWKLIDLNKRIPGKIV